MFSESKRKWVSHQQKCRASFARARFANVFFTFSLNTLTLREFNTIGMLGDFMQYCVCAQASPHGGLAPTRSQRLHTFLVRVMMFSQNWKLAGAMIQNPLFRNLNFAITAGSARGAAPAAVALATRCSRFVPGSSTETISREMAPANQQYKARNGVSPCDNYSGRKREPRTKMADLRRHHPRSKQQAQTHP